MDFTSPLMLIIQRFAYAGVALLGIGFLIGFHELGHFLFCKLFGIRTPTFSIGFGPVIFSRKIGTTNFTLSALPLGGFVEIAGAAEMGQGEQKEAQSKASDSFAVKPYYQKFFVMMGGIIFNLMFAYFAFILLSFIGFPRTPLMYPKNARPIIQQIDADSPAEKWGLKVGDTVTAISDINLSDQDTPLLIQTIQEHPEETIPVCVDRQGNVHKLEVTLGSRQVGSKKMGTLGIQCQMESIEGVGFFQAIRNGIQLTNEWIVKTFQGYAGIFTRADVKNMGGPIMIISLNMKFAAQGFLMLLLFLAIISINLAILNLIPLPILDGGQLLFYTIEAIIGRPLPEKVREYIHIVSWIAVLMLALYLTVNDVGRIAYPYIEDIKKFLGFGR